MPDIIKTPSSKELKEAQETLNDLDKAAEFLNSIMVSTNEEIRSAVSVLAEIKTKQKEIETKRKSLTDPLNKVVKELNSMFKPGVDKLKNAESSIKEKISICIEERLGTRDALIEETANAPDDQRDAILARAEDMMPPEVDGLSVYHKWTGNLTSNQEVVQWAIAHNRFDLLLADTAKLEAMTRAKEGNIAIDGWEPVKKPIVRIEVGKVK